MNNNAINENEFDNEFPDEHSHDPQEVDSGVFGLHVTDEEGRHYYLQINLTGEGMILDLYDRYGEQNLGSWAREWNEVGQMVYEQDPINAASQSYRIQNIDPNDDECMGLFWSNEEGWTKKEYADTFSSDERDALNLPMGGTWVKA